MYSVLKDPLSKKFLNINSNNGAEVLKKYLKFIAQNGGELNPLLQTKLNRATLKLKGVKKFKENLKIHKLLKNTVKNNQKKVTQFLDKLKGNNLEYHNQIISQLTNINDPFNESANLLPTLVIKYDQVSLNEEDMGEMNNIVEQLQFVYEESIQKITKDWSSVVFDNMNLEKLDSEFLGLLEASFYVDSCKKFGENIKLKKLTRSTGMKKMEIELTKEYLKLKINCDGCRSFSKKRFKQKRFYFFTLSKWWWTDDKKKCPTGHSNILLFDTRKKIVYSFEPHGGDQGRMRKLSDLLEIHLINLIPEEYKFYGPKKYEPFIGPQIYLENINTPGKTKYYSGLCMVHSIYFVILKLLNPDTDISVLFGYINGGLDKNKWLKKKNIHDEAIEVVQGHMMMVNRYSILLINILKFFQKFHSKLDVDSKEKLNDEFNFYITTINPLYRNKLKYFDSNFYNFKNLGHLDFDKLAHLGYVVPSVTINSLKPEINTIIDKKNMNLIGEQFKNQLKDFEEKILRVKEEYLTDNDDAIINILDEEDDDEFGEPGQKYKHFLESVNADITDILKDCFGIKYNFSKIKLSKNLEINPFYVYQKIISQNISFYREHLTRYIDSSEEKKVVLVKKLVDLVDKYDQDDIKSDRSVISEYFDFINYYQHVNFQAFFSKIWMEYSDNINVYLDKLELDEEDINYIREWIYYNELNNLFENKNKNKSVDFNDVNQIISFHNKVVGKIERTDMFKSLPDDLKSAAKKESNDILNFLNESFMDYEDSNKMIEKVKELFKTDLLQFNLDTSYFLFLFKTKELQNFHIKNKDSLKLNELLQVEEERIKTRFL